MGQMWRLALLYAAHTLRGAAWLPLRLGRWCAGTADRLEAAAEAAR